MNASLTRILPVLAAGALVLAGCSSDADAPAATATTTGTAGSSVALVTDGVLTVCTNPPFAPFEFEEDGQIVGLDMDVTAEVAKDLGVTQTVLNVGFDALESGAALESGQCDVVATGLSITEERKANLEFSQPYFDADLGILVKKDSGIASEADLAGKRIGVQIATDGEAWVTEHELGAVQFADLGLQIQSLNADQVDAVMNDYAVLGTYTAQGYELLAPVPTGATYGLAVKKGNTALLTQVDATLERIKADGTWAQIYTDRIGVAPSED